MLDSVPHDYAPYVVLLFNTVVLHILRKVFLRFSPASVQLVIAEIIATLELCADCAELGKRILKEHLSYLSNIIILVV